MVALESVGLIAEVAIGTHLDTCPCGRIREIAVGAGQAAVVRKGVSEKSRRALGDTRAIGEGEGGVGAGGDAAHGDVVNPAVGKAAGDTRPVIGFILLIEAIRAYVNTDLAGWIIVNVELNSTHQRAVGHAQSTGWVSITPGWAIF